MKLKLALLTILALFLLLGCNTTAQDSEIVAQVDKETLTLAELKSNFSDSQWKNLSAEQKKTFVQQWINMTLLAQEADAMGMDNDKAIKLKIKYAAKKIKANSLIASRLAAEKVSEEDLFNYYRIHQGEYNQPRMNYKVQRIYVTDNTILSKVLQELENGMKFDDAVRVYSQETLGQTGGFMGTVSPADADSTFWLAVRKVKLFEISTLAKNDGYFILRAYAEEPGTKETGFEASKDDIRRRILDERRKQVYDDLLKELKSKSDVYLMI
jgi:hypothetical protein